MELIRREYVANNGWETFLSYEDPEQGEDACTVQVHYIMGSSQGAEFGSSLHVREVLFGVLLAHDACTFCTVTATNFHITTCCAPYTCIFSH